MKAELEELTSVFINDYSVKHRLVGVGVISKEDAYRLGCVGPMLRASGVDYDLRKVDRYGMTRYDAQPLKHLNQNHKHYTGSQRSQHILENWNDYLRVSSK